MPILDQPGPDGKDDISSDDIRVETVSRSMNKYVNIFKFTNYVLNNCEFAGAVRGGSQPTYGL
jgi:hypothetical protein